MRMTITSELGVVEFYGILSILILNPENVVIDVDCDVDGITFDEYPFPLMIIGDLSGDFGVIGLI